MTPEIHLALRFHVNFYHSYRGDTPDELGFGKDIRIITRILDDLDDLNGQGIRVRGTWDIENFYSLEQLMPAHCPELIERLKRRVSDGRDAVEPMSWNNGITSACTDAEFDLIMRRTLSNAEGSGLADLFEKWEPVVRPQECMYTPSLLTRYPRHGISAISLYYSAHPFNAFSNFMPVLPFPHRYNPLRLTSRDLAGEMVLLPAYNSGDVADNWLSLRHWLKSMRRRQVASPDPRDLLLLIDMDADDEFWCGMDVPVLSRLFPTFDGLHRMVSSVADLPWLQFTTPSDYLADHPPVGTVAIDHDTADGSFDGLASWAEKWSNTRLWSILQAARSLLDHAEALAPPRAARSTAGRSLTDAAGDSNGSAHPGEARLVGAAVVEARRLIALSMSTTHFGLTSPIMNRHRLEIGQRMCEAARDEAGRALALALKIAGRGTRHEAVDLLLPPGTEQENYPGAGTLLRFRSVGASAGAAAVGGLRFQSVELPLAAADADVRGVVYRPAAEAGESVPVTGGQGAKAGETAPEARGPGAGAVVAATSRVGMSFTVAADEIGNGLVSVRSSGNGVMLTAGGRRISAPGSPVTAVRYAGRLRRAAVTGIRSERLSTELASLTVEQQLQLPGAPTGGKTTLASTHRYLVAAGLPYVYVDVHVHYPETAHERFGRALAKRLGASWDGRWNEVMPWEFVPLLENEPGNPLTIWKHNFFGDVTHYALDYFRFSRNRNLDSFNNQLTNGWVAVSGSGGGVLVAQSTLFDNSFAFCPMRLRHNRGRQVVRMNPFGTYHGRQYRYHTRASGLGRVLSLGLSDHLRSYAPSYNGKSSRFSLMIAAYEGGRPGAGLQADAMLFSGMPLVVGG